MKVKASRKSNRSFVQICLLHFALYSICIFILYLVLSYAVSAKMSRTFPSIENMIAYENDLKNEDYSNIPKRVFHNCSFIVFDNEANEIYMSNKNLSGTIKAQNLDLITSYDSDIYYDVSRRSNGNRQEYYWINQLRRSKDNTMDELLHCVILDSTFVIQKGDMFFDRKHLTKEELNLLQGIYQDTKKITKYNYKTFLGEERTLVYISENYTEQYYERKVSEANYLWYIGLPILALVIFIQVMLFSKRIRNCIMPLNKSIVAYGNGDKIQIDGNRMPREFKQIQDNFNDLTNQLDMAKKNKEEADQTKQRMIANISHDLKTPLTVIKGYSKAFLDGMVPEEKKGKYISVIYNKAINTTGLIDSLFEFTKMDHPDFVLQLEQTDLCEFSKEYLAEKYSDIELYQFTIDIQIPEEAYMCAVDRTLIRRLLDNLIDNSLKYNPTDTMIFFRISQSKDSYLLDIGDNGIGISDEIKDQLFDPFVTGDSARTSGNGTGLGMAIVKRIVSLHNGNITLAEPGTTEYSTMFHIVLPKDSKNI